MGANDETPIAVEPVEQAGLVEPVEVVEQAEPVEVVEPVSPSAAASPRTSVDLPRSTDDAPAEPRRRLTLQERLAQAAQTKRKKKQEARAKPEPLTKPETTAEAPVPKSPVPLLLPAGPVAGADTSSVPPDELAQLDVPALVALVRELQRDDKNAQIEALRIEGERLSHTELKLLQTVKRLKEHQRELEEQCGEQTSENARLQKQLVELEEARALFAAQQQRWQTVEADLRKRLEETTNDLGTEQWRTKQAVQQQQDALIEGEQRRLELEAALAELQQAAEYERERASRTKQECDAELRRTESKIESLRFQVESLSVDAAGVDGAEHTRLQLVHDALMEQYQLAQENWRLIELQLMSQVGDLEAEVASARRRDTQLQKKSRVLADQLRAKTSEVERLQAEAVDARAAGTAASVEARGREVEAVQRANELERQLAETEAARETLSARVLQLEAEVRASGGALSLELRLSLASNSTVGFLPPPRRQFLSLSALFELGWGDLASVRAPFRTPTGSQYFEGVDELSDDEGLNGTFQQSNGTPNGRQLQLVGKMLSQVRRLEVELSTCRDEMAAMRADKEEAAREISRLMAAPGEVLQLRTEVRQLQQELEAKEARESTMLEIIGEKEEGIEDLQQDIAVLKQLVRDQAAQIAGQ